MTNTVHQQQDIPGSCTDCDWCGKKWAAHDVYILPAWDEQHRFNTFVRKQLAWLSARWWFAVGLATLGGTVGAFVGTLVIRAVLPG